MQLRRSQRGDTIIEVLFAITVFSLIAIGGLSLMNQGTALAQRALEIGHVRQQIDAQADALRFINRSYTIGYGQNEAATNLWNEIATERAVSAAQPYNEVADSAGCHIPLANNESFALNLDRLSSALDPDEPNSGFILTPTTDTPTYSMIRGSVNGLSRAEGIWIQAVRSPTVVSADDGEERPGYYDFHIRACWFSPGHPIPVTMGTIVRLYEPRG